MDSITSLGTLPGRTPFRLGVTDAEIVPHAAWQAARDQVLGLLDAGTRRIAILGPPGTGKSLLLRDLASTIEPDAVRFVDEADRLDPTGLQALSGVTPCILAGLPAFAGRLAGLPGPIAIVPLNPLSAREIARFVAARLAAAGQQRDLLTPEAIAALASHSGGAPRLINMLASAALFAAELEGASRVTAAHIAEAALMRVPETDLAAPEKPAAVLPAKEAASPRPAPSASAKMAISAPRATIPLAPRPAPLRSRHPALWGLVSFLLVLAAWAVLHARHVSMPLPAPAIDPAPAASSMPVPAAPAPVAAVPHGPVPALVTAHKPVVVAPSSSRMVIQARAGSAVMDEIAALLAPEYGQVERRVVDATPRLPSIRYFFPKDAAAAYALAAMLDRTGLRWHVQNFTSYRPQPRPGTLEIWVP